MAQQSINMKNINKSTGYLIVLIFWLTVITLFSSCQTIREINMSNSAKATQCNWVNNK